MLKEFNIGRGNWVLDPFLGSGTTSLACMEVGVNSCGVDSSPLAVFVSQTKTTRYDADLLEKVSESLFSTPFSRPSLDNLDPLVKRAFSRPVLEDVVFFRDKISEIDENVKGFFMLALMRAAMEVSYAYKDGGVIKIIKKPTPPFRKFFRRIVKKMIMDVRSIKLEDCEAKIMLGDARMLQLPDEIFDAIITSPPYLNKIEYTTVYKIEYELFLPGVKVDAVRSYLGLNPKNIQDPFPELDLPIIARAYFSDMRKALSEMFRVLKPKGKVALVVAGGVFPDRVVESDLLIARLAKDLGFNVNKICVVNRRIATTKRVIKIGEAKESIVFMEKP
ncbi:MAG: DNA methyltransferase [Nitrososphaerota archaeon]|nr:DNA methyltransferase [Aigarchaeota archaeon]MDW8076700.1 DNA methyltransferase [Nitrososphaerota archaeon]